MSPNRPVLQDSWQLMGWTAEDTNTCSWASIWPRAWTGNDPLKLGFRKSNLNVRGRADWKWPDWRQGKAWDTCMWLSLLVCLVSFFSMRYILIDTSPWCSIMLPGILVPLYRMGTPLIDALQNSCQTHFLGSSLVSRVQAYCLQHQCLWVKTGSPSYQMPLCCSVPAFTGTSETRPKMLTGPPSFPLHTQPLLPVSRSLLPCWGLAAVAGLCLSFGSVLRCFPGGTSGKELSCQYWRCKSCRFNPWVGKIPWRRAWQPTPVLLPGKSHGQRSLEGYSPCGCKESDMTEATSCMDLLLST